MYPAVFVLYVTTLNTSLFGCVCSVVMFPDQFSTARASVTAQRVGQTDQVVITVPHGLVKYSGVSI